jgi:hypothetical protein
MYKRIISTFYCIFASQVSDSLTLISPLADFTATEMSSIGLSELPFSTEATVVLKTPIAALEIVLLSFLSKIPWHKRQGRLAMEANNT